MQCIGIGPIHGTQIFTDPRISGRINVVLELHPVFAGQFVILVQTHADIVSARFRVFRRYGFARSAVTFEIIHKGSIEDRSRICAEQTQVIHIDRFAAALLQRASYQ
ncbi:hypothetical protein D3C73_1416740 [compost metagenome]